MTVERITSPADLDGVIAIEDATFNNPTSRAWYEEELHRPDVCFIYVLRQPDRPVSAFCAFWRAADQMHINNLAVHPDVRRQGLGRALLEATLAEARRMGINVATLEVRRSNAAARRLYESAGFLDAGVRRDYYTNPAEDALVLRREVESG